MAQQLGALAALTENPGSIPSTYMVGWLTAIFNSRDQMSSFGFHGIQTCTWYTDIYAGKTRICIKK